MKKDIEIRLSEYEAGIWLINNKKNGYVLPKHYDEKKINYGNGITLSTSKDTFERGELLRKLVSLNRKVLEPVVLYLKTEILSHKDAMEEFTREYKPLESTKAFLNKQGLPTIVPNYAEREEAMLHYKCDRLEELYYQVYHSLVQGGLFETLETFTENEVDLVAHILLAEASAIYEAKSFQLEDYKSYIPEIFWNDELRDTIKKFLCNPSDFKEDALAQLLGAGIKTEIVLCDDATYEVVNIRSFSELIALEVQTIMNTTSDFTKCKKCIVCGRLFYKKTGRGRDICDYEGINGKACKDDDFVLFMNRVYSRLTSFVQANAIPNEPIYTEFYDAAYKLMEDCRREGGLTRFQKELEDVYKKLRKKHNPKELNHYRKKLNASAKVDVVHERSFKQK